MGTGGRGNCAAVAPLLARYNDPDLTEKEQVLLSTHLLGCPQCLARLQEYRALDRRVRTMPSTVLAPHVRAVVLERVAAGAAPALVGPAYALPWRHAWSGAIVACTLAACLLTSGLVALNFAQQVDGRFTGGAVTNAALAQPLAASLLTANPTRAVTGGMSERAVIAPAVVQPLATRPAASNAVIRSVYPAEGRLVVALEGASRDERVLLTRDTAVLYADGRPASVANLVPGLRVQLRCEQLPSGTMVAREVVLSR